MGLCYALNICLHFKLQKHLPKGQSLAREDNLNHYLGELGRDQIFITKLET